jgi:hypothetical protein
MGYFSRIATEIEEMMLDGASVAVIAKKLNLTVEQVEDYIDDFERSAFEYDRQESLIDNDPNELYSEVTVDEESDMAYLEDIKY